MCPLVHVLVRACNDAWVHVYVHARKCKRPMQVRVYMCVGIVSDASRNLGIITILNVMQHLEYHLVGLSAPSTRLTRKHRKNTVHTTLQTRTNTQERL